MADNSGQSNKKIKRIWSEKLTKFIAVMIILIVGILTTIIYVRYFMDLKSREKVDALMDNVVEVFDSDSDSNGSSDSTMVSEEQNLENNSNLESSSGSQTEKKSSQKKKKKKKKKNSSFVFKTSNKRYLKDSELKKLSKKKLAIARNEIYARKGREFTTSKWKKYFSKKSWYKKKYSAKYFDKHEKKLLNKYERANVKKIKKYEKKK